MNQQSRTSVNPLIAKIQRLFSCDLALENDYLWQENRILRRKLGPTVLFATPARAGRRAAFTHDVIVVPAESLGLATAPGLAARAAGSSEQGLFRNISLQKFD